LTSVCKRFRAFLADYRMFPSVRIDRRHQQLGWSAIFKMAPGILQCQELHIRTPRHNWSAQDTCDILSHPFPRLILEGHYLGKSAWNTLMVQQRELVHRLKHFCLEAHPRVCSLFVSYLPIMLCRDLMSLESLSLPQFVPIQRNLGQLKLKSQLEWKHLEPLQELFPAMTVEWSALLVSRTC
jgi:hypothetical protein